MNVEQLGEDPLRRARSRLRRVEGQVRAVERMLEENADCQQVLRQIAAASTALRRVGVQLAVDGIEQCVRTTDAADDLEQFQQAFLELS